ncbi:MAG TPA: hypothetical protein VM165_16910 [Planctomycetaceae bacterium]|nr:hypothetical protein [Planctomycetaceae bacterium]
MTPATLLSDPISPDVVADAEAVIEARLAGRAINPDLLRRVRERAQQVTAAIRQKHGLLDIGIPAIRELRDS